MSKYTKQALKFLSDTNTEFKAKFFKNDLYFPDDQEARDIYEITLTRGERVYKFRFGQSIANEGQALTPYDVLTSLTSYDPDTFEEFCSSYGHETDSRKAERIYKKQIKDNPVYKIFVAELENEIVGAITLLIEQKFIHSGGKVAHIEDVVARKGFQGQRIGSALVKTAIKQAKKEGCYKAILDCEEKNIPFYKKCGFKVWEREMRLDL